MIPIKKEYKGKNNNILIFEYTYNCIIRLSNKYGFRCFYIKKNTELSKKQIYKLILKIEEDIHKNNKSKYGFKSVVPISIIDYKIFFG